MKRQVIEFLKGIGIGIAFIIPGFSGGIMAVAFNVYDKIIAAFSIILTNPIKAFKSLYTLLSGFAIGIFLSLVIISVLLERYPIPTILFFTGLIIGTIPAIYPKTENHGKVIEKGLLSFIGALFIMIFLFIPALTPQKEGFQSGFSLLFALFVLGFIISLSVIIPGVSGSLILLVFGYYEFITDTVVSLFQSMINRDFASFFRYFVVMMAFGLGIVLGIVTFSKLIHYVLKSYSSTIYTIIMGFLIASPMAIIYQMITAYRKIIDENIFFNFLSGLLFLGFGIFIADILSHYEKKIVSD